MIKIYGIKEIVTSIIKLCGFNKEELPIDFDLIDLEMYPIHDICPGFIITIKYLKYKWHVKEPLYKLKSVFRIQENIILHLTNYNEGKCIGDLIKKIFVYGDSETRMQVLKFFRISKYSFYRNIYFEGKILLSTNSFSNEVYLIQLRDIWILDFGADKVNPVILGCDTTYTIENKLFYQKINVTTNCELFRFKIYDNFGLKRFIYCLDEHLKYNNRFIEDDQLCVAKTNHRKPIKRNKYKTETEDFNRFFINNNFEIEDYSKSFIKYYNKRCKIARRIEKEIEKSESFIYLWCNNNILEELKDRISIVNLINRKISKGVKFYFITSSSRENIGKIFLTQKIIYENEENQKKNMFYLVTDKSSIIFCKIKYWEGFYIQGISQLYLYFIQRFNTCGNDIKNFCKNNLTTIFKRVYSIFDSCDMSFCKCCNRKKDIRLDKECILPDDTYLHNLNTSISMFLEPKQNKRNIKAKEFHKEYFLKHLAVYIKKAKININIFLEKYESNIRILSFLKKNIGDKNIDIQINIKDNKKDPKNITTRELNILNDTYFLGTKRINYNIIKSRTKCFPSIIIIDDKKCIFTFKKHIFSSKNHWLVIEDKNTIERIVSKFKAR
ncbi:hypothetical protein SLOPH_1190 [Spraguea lophii 42_110]|uniref:Uncharacterized protein n=1 Tax=Spraguea lophii (strain 42_110) TaxID=1358809 RepID=S7XQY0_SPRLO|nr:hypothetical protein SLOPH_1190 [Spraguea lophii 42_110]